MKFETVIDTNKGLASLTCELDEKQQRYLMELGMRYLITIGVIALPDKVMVPTEEDLDELANIGETFKKSLN